MDAVKFVKERDRMCKSYYDAENGHCSDGCPAYAVQCTDLDGLSIDAEELVTLVEEWSAAHPRKTRQSVFLEQWPQANIGGDGVLQVCPAPISESHRNAQGGCGNIDRECRDCRKEFCGHEVE